MRLRNPLLWDVKFRDRYVLERSLTKYTAKLRHIPSKKQYTSNKSYSVFFYILVCIHKDSVAYPTRHSPHNTIDTSVCRIPLHIRFYVKTFVLAMSFCVLVTVDRIWNWTATKKRMCSLRKSSEPRRKSINTGALVDDHK